MKITVLGGTRFIGRALLSELVHAGHAVLVVHRGRHEPEELTDVAHLHSDRGELGRHRDALASFAPDAVADLSAMTEHDAITALGVFREVRLVVASSIDVYRAFASVWNGSITDAVPLTEESELRSGPPPDAAVPDGWDFDPVSYEKLDVERAYLRQGGVVCRLPMVYGAHDYKHREDFVLARVRAGRRRIPIGSGNWLWSRGYVGEIARGIRLALESDQSGEVFNLAEESCAPIALWMKTIATAADAEVEFVRVPDERLPDDLEIAGTIPQHWLVDSSKARERLGWVHAAPEDCVRQSVRWHLSNAPATETSDFSGDDSALSMAVGHG
jgi:nucleoside-diphosphate-sugar epimerase